MKRKVVYIVAAGVFCLALIGACRQGRGPACRLAQKPAPAVPVDIPKGVVPGQAAPVEAPPVSVPAVQPAFEAAVPIVAPVVAGYNFGDFRSSTLTLKAWEAFARKDTEAVLVYTNKCIDLYSAQAVKMQAGLKDYPSGDDQKVFSYWALNDVATCLFIQGEAYRKAGEKDKAAVIYRRIINEFSYGQAYDPATRTFWKPADGARDAIAMMEKGLDLDYGNMSSVVLVQRMWASLAANKADEVVAYNARLEQLYSQTARDMQGTLKDYPQLPAENIHGFWALNDVGTGMFILGEAYRMAGKDREALAAYKKLVADYSYAQCWDPSGWFWKPAEAAQQKIIELEVKLESVKR